MLALQSKRGWLHRLSARRTEAAGEGDDQGTGHRHPRRRQAGGAAVGRQSAEGGAGALAGVAAAHVLLLDEPTRGIDVGAHAEVVALIRRLCAQGLALLVASSELDETGGRQRSGRGAAGSAQGWRDRRRRHHPREYHSDDCRRMSMEQTSTMAATRSLEPATARACRPPGGVAAPGAGAHPDRRRLRVARLLHHSHRRRPPVRQPDRHPLSRPCRPRWSRSAWRW